MNDTVRPEVSKKNDYWIPKHRYYELKHFCQQYPEWKAARAWIDGYSGSQQLGDRVQTSRLADQTADSAQLRIVYSDRIDMIGRCGNTASFSFCAQKIQFLLWRKPNHIFTEVVSMLRNLIKGLVEALRWRWLNMEDLLGEIISNVTIRTVLTALWFTIQFVISDILLGWFWMVLLISKKIRQAQEEHSIDNTIKYGRILSWEEEP